MSSNRTPLTDELKEILSKCILPQESKVRIDTICFRLGELEFSSSTSENELTSSLPSERLWRRESLISDHRVRQVLQWLCNRGPESVTSIAFGTQVSNEVAGDCLEKLRSINFVELTVEQTKPDKWTITDAGQNYLSQQHSEANS